MNWVDEARGRTERDRCAATPIPDDLQLLDPEQNVLLKRWASSDGARRGRAALLKDAAPISSIERAEALCELLLIRGWIVRREQLVGGTWQWNAITWRDLPRLQSLLGVSSPRLRGEQRRTLIEESQTWFRSRAETLNHSALDPDLLDEIEQALGQLCDDTSLRLELLSVRLQLLRAVAAWHDEGRQGSRRDFALHARGTTKALGEADWRWLEGGFDLERLRIARFASMAWLAGDITLNWSGQQVNLASLHCLGLPLADLKRASSASTPARWWLIENRASFERQAQQREAGLVLLWMPGRPSVEWLESVGHLLRLAPAPAWISADADPSGVDIACTVGAVWQAQNLSWDPYRMGVDQWAATSQYWPLNDHDRHLLEAQLARSDLPRELRELCLAMQREGRKAEQEGWI
ncbi:MAG: DUF2399 domain-containing protein [Azonexus sp.]|jgi:hypothetical protein|uniref:DUF2399 domain-containing protein n=1 Tax=Azonexus sp. TaxID=1872668 RepID=UPI00282F667E|nr:DUF2399 domain-containing protein [Azonexus sp.]MDR0777480.1 DUF2399 domain-containing protein [Azonexus sp.]